jgi:hypothetical protein
MNRNQQEHSIAAIHDGHGGGARTVSNPGFDSWAEEPLGERATVGWPAFSPPSARRRSWDRS